MTHHLALLDKLRQYIHLRIDGNLPSVQTEYQEKVGGFWMTLFINAPITFQDWLTYPYETREEQEKQLWA